MAGENFLNELIDSGFGFMDGVIQGVGVKEDTINNDLVGGKGKESCRCRHKIPNKQYGSELG